MSVDIEKLEALAEAAIDQEKRWKDAGEPWPVWNKCLLEMQASANPAAVLELTTELRDAKDAAFGLKWAVGEFKAENAGLKTGYEAYERVNAELNQRIANLELCQTASLGVSGIIKSAASELGFNAAGEDSALDYLIGLARKAGALRAECEALRKDKDRLDALEGNFWDVRHSSEALADTGDYTSGVEVIGHWMDKPFERVIGENYTESLRAAIDQAMTADAYPPARPDYSELDAAMDSEATQ